MPRRTQHRTRFVPEELTRAGFRSWAKLAAACGVSATAISSVRTGKHRLSPGLRDKLAAALGVPPATVVHLMLQPSFPVLLCGARPGAGA